VMAAAIHTEGPARWRMVFTPRIDSPGDSVDSITAKENRTIEQQIRKAPEDWLWVHNRWKTPKPHFLLTHYKRGVYVPPEASDLKPFRILIRSSNWLGDSIKLDSHGFILTGSDLVQDSSKITEAWPLERLPLLLETIIPGIFAAGDVRHGSVKRIAAGVGEGSTAIQLIHDYLSKGDSYTTS